MRRFIKQQNGAALVGVMMALLVLTLLGTTAFLTSNTELKISSNYNQSLQALYAAEAGLQALLSAYRQNPEYFLQKNTALEMNFPVDEPDHSNRSGTQFWIKALRYDSQEIPAYAEVIIYGKDNGRYSLARLRATILCTQSGETSDVPQIFKVGIVTAGRLNLNGPLSIVGDLHANQGFSIEPSSVLEQLKSQHSSLTQSLDPLRPDYLPPMEVPMISENGFQNYRTIAQQKGNQTLFGRQNLFLSGDQKGHLIFVDGNVTLQGSNLSGVTLVATGSITLNGVTVLNREGNLDSAFIAGRDIMVNEFSQLAGVFWANGSIKKLGSGKLSGALVCQGNISQMEGFQFERASQISNAFLSPTATPYSFTLGGWSQI
ncbi:MAG: PilX N-terminal domain-containing pilus assembly protein [Pseudomonadota bacterium]